MEAGPTHVAYTGRWKRYTREELTRSLGRSLHGHGPDRYEVTPAERNRFAVQLQRRRQPNPTLTASIPAGSSRARRSLLDHGWGRASVGRTRYYQRSFIEAEAATAAIVDAYEAVYGDVGDDKGWTIATPATDADKYQAVGLLVATPFAGIITLIAVYVVFFVAPDAVAHWLWGELQQPIGVGIAGAALAIAALAILAIGIGRRRATAGDRQRLILRSVGLVAGLIAALALLAAVANQPDSSRF